MPVGVRDYENDEFLAGYHIKEIERNLFDDLEYRMELLGKIDKDLMDEDKKRLDEFKEKF